MKFTLLRTEEPENKGKNIPSPLSIHPPLDLLYIGAALEQIDQDVEIIDFTKESQSRGKLENILKKSDAIGINVQTKNLNAVSYLSRTIKEIDSQIPLIIGGPHCTFFHENTLLSIPDADISVVGDGEQVIVDIVKFLKDQISLPEINGVYYRENNQIKAGKPPQLLENLDSLPFPARHLVEKYEYGIDQGLFNMFKKKFTNMITSRGCPSRCRFCSQYRNEINGYSYRQRTAENVVEEILGINEKYGSVMIVDDNFLVDKKRAHKIFDILLEAGTQIEFLLLGARVDSADKELYLKMKKANVKFLCFGLESGNQDVLDFYKKNVTLKQIQKAVKLANDMGFITYGSFIMGAPFETKKHLENTIKFACSLPLDIADFRPLLYQKGSDLWIEAVKDNKILPIEESVISDSKRNLGYFTEYELEKYAMRAYRHFYFRPIYIIGQIHRTILRRNTSLLKNNLRYFNY